MTDASWDTADLNRPVYAADLIINALNRTPDNPAVNIIGQREMTAREMSAMVSRYSQALASKGLTQGKQLSVLALNRPEVLFNMAANLRLPVGLSAARVQDALEAISGEIMVDVAVG